MKSKTTLSLISIALASFFACSDKPEGRTRELPIFGEKKVLHADTVYHHIGDFSLLNQYGEPIGLDQIKDHIVVANFFFASCQSICPEMSSNLKLVQDSTTDVLFLSHSVNPLHDSVEVLRAYAERYGAIKGRWHFLTGDKAEIYDLAKTSYLVNAIEDDGSPEGFLHSEMLLLIDGKGRIRGMYDGTYKPDVQKLIQDIALLKKEYVF